MTIINVIIITNDFCHYFFYIFSHVCRITNFGADVGEIHGRPSRCSGEASHGPSRAQWNRCRHAAEALLVGARAGGAW